LEIAKIEENIKSIPIKYQMFNVDGTPETKNKLLLVASIQNIISELESNHLSCKIMLQRRQGLAIFAEKLLQLESMIKNTKKLFCHISYIQLKMIKFAPIFAMKSYETYISREHVMNFNRVRDEFKRRLDTISKVSTYYAFDSLIH
jgi:hypothetical protein